MKVEPEPLKIENGERNKKELSNGVNCTVNSQKYGRKLREQQLPVSTLVEKQCSRETQTNSKVIGAVFRDPIFEYHPSRARLSQIFVHTILGIMSKL